MKIKLLNDGGYEPLKYVKFPAVVEGKHYCGGGFGVPGYELIRIGGNAEWLDHDYDYFFTIQECEIVDE